MCDFSGKVFPNDQTHTSYNKKKVWYKGGGRSGTKEVGMISLGEGRE